MESTDDKNNREEIDNWLTKLYLKSLRRYTQLRFYSKIHEVDIKNIDMKKMSLKLKIRW